MGAGKPTRKRPRGEDTRWSSMAAAPPPALNRFNDPSTADVVVSIAGNPAVKVYVHSAIICRRSGYFAALLSDRWRQQPSDVVPEKLPNATNISLTNGSTDTYVSVLRLLYVDDIWREIHRASLAIQILPVAQELLFEDCISACVRFLEAVPWTDEEELRVMDLIPHLNGEESRELLCRVSPSPDWGEETVDELLYGMVLGVVDDTRKEWEQGICSKLSVSRVLRDFTTRESAGRALDRAFERTLNIFKGKLSSHANAVHSEVRVLGRDLLWLVETMVALRVADNAVKWWSELPFSDMEGSLCEEFRQTYGNLMPLLPFSNILLKCTSELATAVAAGTVLAPRQIRIKLVKDWVRLLSVYRKQFSAMEQSDITVCQKLEKTILSIMSTLPMSEAKESLQHCVSYKPLQDHYIAAFSTWFRRASQASRSS